jgi:hypothetical protein
MDTDPVHRASVLLGEQYYAEKQCSCRGKIRVNFFKSYYSNKRCIYFCYKIVLFIGAITT